MPTSQPVILLVEDDPSVLSLIATLLLRLGYVALTANNGTEAMKLARQHSGPIHLLLSDVVMPSMSGLELAQQFRSSFPDTPVLLMSGYADSEPRELEPGWYFISKPFRAAQLLEKIEFVLSASARKSFGGGTGG
jgi:two-component system cell cycle sensor histidine kinase/response regulator CckA